MFCTFQVLESQNSTCYYSTCFFLNFLTLIVISYDFTCLTDVLTL